MNGNIEQLNFKVILDDADFNAKVKAVSDVAQSFNTSMTNAFNITKAFGKEGAKGIEDLSKALDKAKQSAKGLGDEVDKNTGKQRAQKAAVAQTNAELLNSKSIMTTLSQLTGVMFSVVGIRQFLSTLINVTGEFEKQKMALTTMLQDAASADRIFQELYDFSSESTYRFSELAKYAKQLAAFNIGQDNLLETTKMLGDVASGVGVSMDRLILAYGHVKSSGFLRGIQLRSFSQNGVPILDELSKMFTEIEGKAVSLGDVFDRMTKRQIPFEMVEEAFRRMTSEGGKFYQMQEVLAQTLSGQINILKGKWENMMYAVGQSKSGAIKTAVQGLQWLVDNFKSVADAIVPVITGFGAYVAALALISAASKVKALFILAQEFLLVAKNSGIAAAAVLTFGSAAKAAAAGFGVLIAAITAIALVVNNTTGAMEKFRKRLDEIHNSARDANAFDEEISEMETLRKILNDTNNSYDERKRALDRIKQIVPSYHADLTEEGRLINNNVKALDKYIDALKREAKMKGAQAELVELYKERRSIVRERDKAQAEADKYPAPGDKGYVPLAAFNSTYAVDSKQASRDLANANSKLAEVDARIASITNEVKGLLGKEEGNTDSLVYDISSVVEGIKKNDAEIKKLREKAKTKGITAAEKENLDELVKDRESQAKFYKDIMGVDYDKDVKAGASAANKAIKDRIAGLKAEAQALQKYRQTFEALSGIVGPEMAKTLTGEVYKDAGITNFDFVGQIQKLAGELRALGDAASADSILATLGTDEGKDLQQRLRQVQQTAKAYRNMAESWAAKDMDADEDTFLGKMTKIVSDFKTKSNEAFLKYRKGMEQLRSIDINAPGTKEAVIKSLIDEGMTEEAANEFWDTFVVKGEGALTELYTKNLGYLRKNAQRSANALADEVVKDTREKLNMKDWGDKSFGQVRDIMKGIEALLADESFGVSGEVIQKVKDAGLTLDEFFDLVRKGYEDLAKESRQENLKKITRLAKSAASQFGSLAQDIKELGQINGNDALVTIGDTIDGISSAVSNIAAGFAAGGPWGAAIASVVEAVKQVTQALTEAAELEVAIADARAEARRLRMESSLADGTDSIFGDDPLKKVSNAILMLERLKKEIPAFEKELASQTIEKTYTSSIMNPLPLETMLDNLHQRLLGFNANLLSRVNKDWTAYQDAIKKGYSGIEAYIVKTGDKSGFWNLLGIRDEYMNLKDLIEGLGYDMYDEYGNLNAKALQAILDKYKKLGKEDRKWIQEAIDNSEVYAEAVKQIDEVMSELFGDLASSAADTLVDQWIEAGNAALDYADILDDVAKSYSKMLVKSMILDKVFNDESTKALKDAFLKGDYATAMSMVQSLMQQVEDLSPDIQAILQAFNPYYNKDSERTASSKALSSNFSQDTIDYWSGQLTLLVEYARRGDEKMDSINGLTLAIRDSLSGDRSFTANVQTYLAGIKDDTSAIRSDIYSVKLAIQNMNDHGVSLR